MLQVTAVVELVWQDSSGSNAVTQLRYLASLTHDEIASDAEAFGAILASLTGCVLIGIRIKYRSEPALPVLLTGGSPITRTGIFFFSTGSSTPDGLISVPAIKDSVVLSDGPSAGAGIDLSNSDVIAFGDAVVANGISNPFADLFTALFAAYIQSRV